MMGKVRWNVGFSVGLFIKHDVLVYIPGELIPHEVY